MAVTEIFMLALALAMDAFAVSVGTGCSLRKVQPLQYARMALAFGLFQFFMPVLGWYLGLTVQDVIQAWDHWVAFALLAWIGGSMIRASFSHNTGDDSCPVLTQDPTSGKPLLILAVATSIDALAVGLSFSLLNVPVWGPSAVIGVVCAILTLAGLYLGQRLAKAALFGSRAELLGGCVLVGIGIKILFEHGVM